MGDGIQHIQQKLAGDQCVILDGGVATELQRLGPQGYHLSDKDMWGTWALYHAPHAVLEVHRRYAETGCDLITTNTWGILDASATTGTDAWRSQADKHWMDVARLGIRLARQAVEEKGRTGQCAVAFSVAGDIDGAYQRGTLELLSRMFREDPPDLILVETLSLVPESLHFPEIETVLASGLPVWLSYRRCRHGVCGVYGQHWGGPEGDLFGRAARKLEEMGVGALMINCLPVSHVPGMMSWLRDFTDLPLGVYPNLGHYLDPEWMFDDRIGPDDYANLALQWREEGAQIIGGCCGVTPDHIAAARERLEGTRPGHKTQAAHGADIDAAEVTESTSPTRVLAPWTDPSGRQLFPIPFPEIVCDPGVFLPTPGSFLVWKYLLQNNIGKELKCLELGCGTGLLTIQLALNGAASVHAIDIQRDAVANTMTNAFRNDVADRVTGEAADLFAFLPREKYQLIVASLYQMPVDPRGQISGHRPTDFWGRNLFDHLITLLPDLLEPDGIAYLMQISLLGQFRTSELMENADLNCRVVDFGFLGFSDVFNENMEQIRRVEELSDAYHLSFRDHNEMVMYLLEVTHRTGEPA